MSTLTWITEKELEREIKPKETNFVERKTKKEKGEMLAASKAIIVKITTRLRPSKYLS